MSRLGFPPLTDPPRPAAIRGAGYTGTQILAIVTAAVQFPLTSSPSNLNQAGIDIPSAHPAGTPG